MVLHGRHGYMVTLPQEGDQGPTQTWPGPHKKSGPATDGRKNMCSTNSTVTVSYVMICYDCYDGIYLINHCFCK